jgi:cysteine synthase A
MVYLSRVRDERPGIIAAKMECMNPSGSIKDRTVLYMLRDAETRGQLKAGDTIIESTSGNTGISLAAFSALRGYRLILTMPESTGSLRLQILHAYGAEVVQTPAEEGMRGALLKAIELHDRLPGSYMPQQFLNPANPKSHFQTTAREIWRDTRGEVRAVVAGIGTGGTISGIGRALKRMDPQVRIVGVEPRWHAVLSNSDPVDDGNTRRVGACGIDGIGAGFVPQTLDQSVVDEVIAVEDKDARRIAHLLARKEGLLAGSSSGAAVFAALKVAEREEMRDKLIVVICPDNGLKYLGTELFK